MRVSGLKRPPEIVPAGIRLCFRSEVPKTRSVIRQLIICINEKILLFFLSSTEFLIRPVIDNWCPYFIFCFILGSPIKEGKEKEKCRKKSIYPVKVFLTDFDKLWLNVFCCASLAGI